MMLPKQSPGITGTRAFAPPRGGLTPQQQCTIRKIKRCAPLIASREQICASDSKEACKACTDKLGDHIDCWAR